ncbi:Acetyltransferase (GNAT) domain-containing protein [Nocardioides terrae]|uniref:Acetyltransferase (GNAT) domain-containing protein n=1 Tax=Nocardioides terrae TaxID=574651 RepID=A0A1I1IXZ3_9ACTN|nr:GNAT family N-acetyltransferase [Nocardioides terrae]SFC39238.1 Acetyltransferase (GNAT) domain-containing protein [Nocardioides terrae]
MSWSGLTSDRPVSLVESPLESARFGRSVARLLVSTGTGESDADIAALVGGSNADVVIVRYPALRVPLFARLAATGRVALFADQLDYWRLGVGEGRASEAPAGMEVVPIDALPPSVGRRLVDDLVGEIFEGYGNHYLADPLFDPELALQGYREWAQRTVDVAADGDACLVLRDGDQAVGLATTSGDGEHREIELAGIRPAWQGRGHYAHLLSGVEEWARQQGEEAIVISTQVHNTGVRRAWTRYGFEPVEAFTTVHLVSPRLLPQSSGSSGWAETSLRSRMM